jgi:HAD superfamily hydrolase (TIGR01549 family)
VTTDLDALLFDIDGTICEYDRGIADLLEIAFEEAGVETFFSPADYKTRFATFTDESASMTDLRERCFADIAREYDVDPAIGREVARAYATARDHSNVHFVDGAAEVLEQAREDYRLAAVTNGAPEMQSTKLDALGIECFETVVHAGYEAPAKPDPEPFEQALQKIDVSPDRAVYIGDSLDADVGGARNAGLSVAWLSDGETVNPTPEPTYIFDSPVELLDRPWIERAR